MAQTAGRTQTARWMRGASASVRGALLGLVLERPGQGGDLANRLRIRLGDTWRLDSNDVYRLLEGLQQEGLVQSLAEPHPDPGRRPIVTYHPTEETARALTLWMETLLPREPSRSALQAKLAVARPEDADRMIDALTEHEESCLILAQLVAPSLGEGQRSWTALCLECTREAAFTQLEAEMKWAQRTRERITEQVARSSPRR